MLLFVLSFCDLLPLGKLLLGLVTVISVLVLASFQCYRYQYYVEFLPLML